VPSSVSRIVHPQSVLLLSFLAFPTLSLSALPPGAEAAYRASALKKAIKIREQANVGVQGVVQSVEITYSWPQCRQKGTARVSLQVTETLHGTLSPDVPLVISYEHYLYECPGPIPHQNKIPGKGEALEAWLRCEGAACTPVSGYGAFVPLAELQQQYQKASSEAAFVVP